MSTDDSRNVEHEQGLEVQRSKPEILNVAYNSIHNQVKSIQQAPGQSQAVPTSHIGATATSNASAMMTSNVNQATPPVLAPPQPYIPLQQNHHVITTQPTSAPNNNWSSTPSSTTNTPSVTMATATKSKTSTNNQGSSSTISSSASPSSQPQHVRPSSSLSHPGASCIKRDIAPYSNSSSSNVSAHARAPAVPISVMALPYNTPNLQSSIAVSSTSSAVISAAGTATSNQHLPHARNSQQRTQTQTQPILQKSINSSVTKYASVPTNKLASKSVISLTPSFLQTLNNQRIHNVGRASSNATASTGTSSPSSLAKQSPGSGRNEKKRSSPDAETQHAKKMSKATDANATNSSPVAGVCNTAATEKSPISPPSNKPVTLQSYFDNLLKSRGYSTLNYCSLENGYCSKPSELQIASHGLKVIQGVRKSDLALLTSLLEVGLSPNPCNKFGESIIHMICRRGDLALLKLFVKYGSSLQVCDDFGRTPLHDACWTSMPNFEIIDLILTKDRRLMNIVDCRGSSPLSYVKREHWNDWIQFFERVKEKFWAYRDVKSVGEEPVPELVSKAPNSMTVAAPITCTKIEDITLVAMGKIDPESVRNNGRKKDELRGEDQDKKESITSPIPLTSQHLVIH